MKPIYLHIAYSTATKDRKLTLVGDCSVVLHDDSGLQALKAEILKAIEKDFPEKEWNEITITSITKFSKETYYRLFPELSTTQKVPNVTDRLQNNP